MNNRKKRETLVREMDEVWTDAQLLKLKKSADTIIEKLYPDAYSSLVETDDIAGSYLNNFMPFTPTATRPYIEGCMHKSPPYSLGVERSLLYKGFQIHIKKDPSLPPENITLRIKGCFAKNLTTMIYLRYAKKRSNTNKNASNLIKGKVNDLEYLENIINSIYLTEDKALNTQYEKNKRDLISSRKDKLKTDLELISQDPILRKEEAFKKLDKIFDTFFLQFPVQASENSDTCKTVIKYRFFAHIIILFLKVAGSKKSNNYTPTLIKKYQEDIKGEQNGLYTNIRHRIENTHIHNTLPSSDELKAIKKYSNKLFALLHGRTEKYDHLIYLDQLADPKKGDFTIDGRISTKKNLELRSFIKSLAMFFCLYHYDRLSGYSMVLTEQEFDIEFKKITDSISQLTTQIVDAFFDSITIAFIEPNTKGIYQYIRDLIIHNKNAYAMPISHSTDEARQMAATIQFTQKSNHSYPDLLHHLKNEHNKNSSTEDRKKWCEDLQLTTCGSFFWHDLFEYHGQVNNKSATVTLNKLEAPTLSKEDLEAHRLHALSLLKQQKEGLLSGQIFPWQEALLVR